MFYETVNATIAPKAPDAPGVLGYLYNNGGLNNQRMALVSLILTGVKQCQPVNLPYIYNKDQRIQDEYLARVEHVFDLGRIVEFAARHDLTVLSDLPGGIRGGWEFFTAFQSHLLDASDQPALATVLDAIACLRPRIIAHSAFAALKNFVFGAVGIDMVVQLRIEADWREHVEIRMPAGMSEWDDSGIGFTGILTKLKNTFPDLRMAYATSDEASMPATKDEIRAYARQAFGIELFWKTDFLPADFLQQATPLDLSLIDFEIARASRRFVGLTTSTFANMLCIDKLAATRKPVRGHYIFNMKGDVVVERRDNGFCLGGQALEPTFADALLQAPA